MWSTDIFMVLWNLSFKATVLFSNHDALSMFIRHTEQSRNRKYCGMYEVVVLKEGYSIAIDAGHMKACGTITLLKGHHIIIVDTGNPWDRNLIVEGLRSNGLSPENVDYCICTHGHSDHVGNLNLFTNAVHIVSYDVCRHDEYIMHDFKQGIPFEIDEFVEVVPTPGHTGSDVSVLVKTTALGLVALTGDLFECSEDLERPDMWQDNSDFPEQQERSRIAILRVADHIVPGHGPMFPVPGEHRKQLRVVMVYAENVVVGLDTSQDYLVSEEGVDDHDH